MGLPPSETKLAAQFGIVALRDSSFKFEFILLCLRDVAAAAHLGEFSAELLGALRMVYGSQTPIPVATMVSFYEGCVETATKGGEVDPAVADEVRSKLKEEIECFEKLKQVYFPTENNVSPSLLDSRLLPSNKDSKKLNRYDITLARQFHDALDQFMEYRRFRLTLGGIGEQAVLSVEASPCVQSSQAVSAEVDDSSCAAKTDDQQATLGSDG